jgi:aminocarboxymuconate-semialdehyde decarboxylase
MKIDIHGHFLPAPFCRRLREWDAPLRIESGASGAAVEEGRIETHGETEMLIHDHGAFQLAEAFVNVDSHLTWMESHDIDRQILSVSAPHPNDSAIADEQVVELTRAINEGYADLQDRYPDRISALGSIPLREPDAALDEIDRIVDAGLVGVTVPTSFRGRSLADPALTPVFDRIEAEGLPVLAHPRPNEFSAQLDDDEWMLTPLCAFLMDTTFQVSRLIFDGFFDRHDDLDFIAPHLGGALPYIVGRLERGQAAFADGISMERPVMEYLESLYFDVISFHPPALAMAIETVGTDRLLFGTDHPFAMEAAEQTIGDVESLGLSDGEEAAIFADNARELFGLQ